MNSRLSYNFYINEFVTSSGITIKPTQEQYFCLQVLCKKILQPIRDQFGTLVVTSGLRDITSYNRLVKKGYSPSKTSDHFGWSIINPKGTGAADITCPGKDMLDVFHYIIKYLYNNTRQIIYYPDMNFIHVANSFNNIFCMEDSISDSRRVMIKKKNEKFQPYIPSWLCNDN